MYKTLGYSECENMKKKLWCMQYIILIKQNIKIIKEYLSITEKIKAGYSSYITRVNYNILSSIISKYDFVIRYYNSFSCSLDSSLLLGYMDAKNLFYELIILQNIKLVSLYMKQTMIPKIDYSKLSVNLYNSHILKNPEDEKLITQAFGHIMELLGYKDYVYLQEAEPISDYYELDFDYCLENCIWDLRIRLPLPERDKLTHSNMCDIASWCEDVMDYNPQETGYNWSYFDAENLQISIMFEWYSKFDYDLLCNFLELIKRCERLKLAKNLKRWRKKECLKV